MPDQDYEDHYDAIGQELGWEDEREPPPKLYRLRTSRTKRAVYATVDEGDGEVLLGEMEFEESNVVSLADGSSMEMYVAIDRLVGACHEHAGCSLSWRSLAGQGDEVLFEAVA